jgi:hypothetical protein
MLKRRILNGLMHWEKFLKDRDHRERSSWLGIEQGGSR